MLFVDLNENFHVKSLTVRGNTMRKTTRLVCDITLPGTGVDKTDNLPIGITETLHMPRLIMVFTSFDAFILPLEKWSREIDMSSKCGW